MKDWVELLTTSAKEQLSGEQFVAAVPLAARGSVRNSARSSAGLIWSAAPEGNAIAGERLPNHLVFGMTPTRLFVFELLTKTATAGEVKAIVPLDVVTGVNAQRTKTYFVRQLNVDISLNDNSQLLLEAGWPAVAKGEEFVNALASAIASRES